MGKRMFRILGIISLVIGALFLLNSFSGITGFVIVEEVGRNVSGVLGLIFVLVGMVLMLADREGESELEISIKEAVKQGVPREEAKNLFDDAKRKIESGKWVELKVFRVRATANQETYPYGTSLCRYWGPEEYKGLSQTKLDNLYKEGKIGKTHEILIGSNKYKIGGRLSEGTVSVPPRASRVQHRHWEIAQMYKYRKRKEQKSV